VEDATVTGTHPPLAPQPAQGLMEREIGITTSYSLTTINQLRQNDMAFRFQRPNWIPRWVNIPLIIFIIFVMALAFYGDNSFMRSTEYRSQINELKSQIKNLEDSTDMYEAKVNELNTDNESLEHLVREKYGMKRINEEVYITDIP
jgi:cell division protein FtsB